MKNTLLLLLLIQSGLVWGASGRPCLPKDANRTINQYLKEIHKPENSVLYKETRANMDIMLYNLGEDPVQNDRDFDTIVRVSETLTKSQLNSRGVQNIHNGFLKSSGTIGYVKQALKDGYVYLVYKNVVYAALTCGNPAKIFRNKETGAIQHQSDTIRHVTVIYDTIKTVVVQNQNVSTTKDCWGNTGYQYGTGYASSATENFRRGNDWYVCPIGNCYGNVYYQPQFSPQPIMQPCFNCPQRFIPVRQGVQQPPPTQGGPVPPNHTGGGPVPPNHGGQNGGPVPPNHTGVGNPTTPVQGTSGGPVTPRGG